MPYRPKNLPAARTKAVPVPGGWVGDAALPRASAHGAALRPVTARRPHSPPHIRPPDGRRCTRSRSRRRRRYHRVSSRNTSRRRRRIRRPTGRQRRGLGEEAPARFPFFSLCACLCFPCHGIIKRRGEARRERFRLYSPAIEWLHPERIDPCYAMSFSCPPAPSGFCGTACAGTGPSSATYWW